MSNKQTEITTAKNKSAAKKAAPRAQTILGKDTNIKGTLKSQGHVQLDGTFTGDISACGQVVLGEGAKISGNIVGETVTVGGVVRGNITARKITIQHTGRVIGDLRQEALFTEDGGFFQGMITMEEALDIDAIVNDEGHSAEEIVDVALEQIAQEREKASVRHD